MAVIILFTLNYLVHIPRFATADGKVRGPTISRPFKLLTRFSCTVHSCNHTRLSLRKKMCVEEQNVFSLPCIIISTDDTKGLPTDLENLH